MKLTTNPIVCQSEEAIPPQVRKLRADVRRYMIFQHVWLSILLIAIVNLILIYTPGILLFFSGTWPSLGKILDIIPSGLLIMFVLPSVIYTVLGRLRGPSWVERYYESRLVLLELTSAPKQIGNFTWNDICRLLRDVSNRMRFLIDPGVYIYDKYKAEANAFYTNLVDHHTKTEKIVLHKNLLFILNEEELRAVIAHELGHMLHPWPLLFRSKRYGRTCELLADYNALLYAGLLPTVNALIKISARRSHLTALWTTAQHILLERNFSIGSIEALAQQAEAQIRHRELGDDDGEHEALRLARRLTKRMPSQKLTRWQRIKHSLKLRQVKKLRVWRKRWKTHIPLQFQRFYADHHINEREFEALIQALKDNSRLDLFAPSLSDEQRKASHPPLRERLLFLAEAARSMNAAKFIESAPTRCGVERTSSATGR